MTANEATVQHSQGTAAAPAGAGPLLRRDLPPYGLGPLLCQLGARRLTGRLELVQDTGSRTLYLVDGYPVFAQSTQFSERLGAVGLRYGLVARDALTAALANGRERGIRLGHALLERGGTTGSGLFQLLSTQFVEQMARACGPEPAKAIFIEDASVPATVATLGTTALSATLWAVRNLPVAARAAVMEAIGGCVIESDPLAPLASEWLTNLGYMGDPHDLLMGAARLDGARSKLMARLRTTSLALFDPTLGVPGRRGESGRLNARQAADAVTLTLLLCGAARIAEPEALPDLPEDATPEATLLLQALRRPTQPIPEGPLGLEPSHSALDPEHLYLTTPRDSRVSAQLELLGPTAELDPSEPGLDQILGLYLTHKPVSAASGAQLQDHRQLATNLAAGSASILCRTRAEAVLAMMDAVPLVSVAAPKHTSVVRAKQPATPATPTSAPPAAPSPAGERWSAPSEAAEDSTRHSAPALESQRPRRTSIHTLREETRESDQLQLRVEALLEQGRWADVVTALAGQPRGSLPPTCRLALKVAKQQERESRSAWPRTLLLAALALVLGYVAGQQHVLEPALGALFRSLPPGLLP